jgi:phospholipid/cholesterol/gamma-HCH transport system substrate-binding protein
LVIFVLGVFTLGSQKKSFVKSFTVDVIFNDIQGLKAGNNVWFSGVKIGTIKKIQFSGYFTGTGLPEHRRRST